MKKILVMIVVIVCQAGCTSQAAEPEPVIVDARKPVAGSTSGVPSAGQGVYVHDAAQDERVQEFAEAEREYQEQVAEIQREWTQEQEELRDEMAELEREWAAAEIGVQEELNEELRDYEMGMDEARIQMIESMDEARKGLEQAKMSLSSGNIRGSGSNHYGLSLPNLNVISSGFHSPAHTERSILFIPQKPIDTNVAEQLSEDMQVMSMILEKAVDMYPATEKGPVMSLLDARGINMFLGRTLHATEAIYLENYGMIFKLKVDFPLLLIGGDDKPDQEPEQDMQDEVWHQNMNELKGLEEPTTERNDSAVEFDPEKVALLRDKLIKTFKHASNIRNLSDNDRVIFVVSGHVGGQPGRFYGETANVEHISVPTSVMTLQAAKKDIDAFGSASMDLETFTKKVSDVVY